MTPEERDTLLELLSHVFESDDEIDGLVYLDIQKIFYHLRERLDDENTIKELLPYYWYIDGVVSDTVQETVNHGLDTGVLQSKPTAGTGTGEWYEPGQEGVTPAEGIGEDDIATAKREIKLAIEEDYDVFRSHEDKIQDVYGEAPYDFQRYFKLNILFAIEQFSNDRPLYLGTDNLASEISTAEAYLPLDTEFDEFNTLFSRYVNTAKRYLSAVGEQNRILADRFKQLSDGVWRLYCQQLRLLEHDSYYDSKREEWEDEYQRTRQFVANDLVEFRQAIDDEFDEANESNRVSEDSSWGKIAAKYLDNQSSGE
ncbi:hypothetical protein NDI56_20150 [Haloarcula sp. S1CR25-12]|uniref:Uncharacterized protein n=1 Tax=Haloarcula saliterrae TaxID=2950534 RepID=A0ABU2FHH9_9EURY|nr:hypothetical protein [Haloarcula sp. S1CR25-12]MDS0261719.1 hypothetical protein [Haloarcula sp. S1CR25-12]